MKAFMKYNKKSLQVLFVKENILYLGYELAMASI